MLGKHLDFLNATSASFCFDGGGRGGGRGGSIDGELERGCAVKYLQLALQKFKEPIAREVGFSCLAGITVE